MEVLPRDEKHLVTYSGYFILNAKVMLGMGMPDSNIILCNGIREQSRDKKFSIRVQ